MELLGIKNFAVLYFTPEIVRGAKFERTDKQWKLVNCSTAPIDNENPAAAWKTVLKAVTRRDTLLVLTGALPDGVFFQFNSVELSSREQRGAVELELSRHLVQIPENRIFQFASGTPGEDLRVPVGVYLFENQALNSVAARMSQCSGRADGFVYPFLALEPGDPKLFLPEIEPNFAFANGSWHPVTPADAEECNKAWLEILSKTVKLPQDGQDNFDFNAMLPLLVTAKMVIDGKFLRNRSALAVLPEKLRPVRFRGHIIVTVLLLILLALNGLWHCSRTWGADYKKFRALQNENRKLKRDIDTARRSSKRLLKEQKEMERVIAAGAGDPDVIAKFALICNALPGNVLVSNVRWTENSVDMLLQCEDAKLDLPRIINPLGYWKIGQLQQRQYGDSAVATITLKLVPKTAEVKK